MTTVNLSGTVEVVLPPASDTQLGGVMVQSGSGLAVDGDGNLSCTVTTDGTAIVYNITDGQDLSLDAGYDVYIVNNAQIFHPTVPGVSAAYWSTPGINYLTLPTPTGDGHTFKLVATAPTCPYYVVYPWSGAGSAYGQSGSGLISFAFDESLTGGATSRTIKIPGTFRYVSSITSWVQIA